MQTAEEIRDMVAKRNGFEDWASLSRHYSTVKKLIPVLYLNQIQTEYASQACEEQKRICAKDFQQQFFGPTEEERAVILQAALPELK